MHSKALVLTLYLSSSTSANVHHVQQRRVIPCALTHRYAWFAPHIGNFDWIGPTASLLEPDADPPKLTALGRIYMSSSADDYMGALRLSLSWVGRQLSSRLKRGRPSRRHFLKCPRVAPGSSSAHPAWTLAWSVWWGLIRHTAESAGSLRMHLLLEKICCDKL